VSVNVTLRELAELAAPERAFLSVYLNGPRAMATLADKFEKLRRALAKEDSSAQAVKDERRHFEENVNSVREYLAKNPITKGSLALFSCQALEFFRALPIPSLEQDLIWIDSSPYIRPLARFEEEYETAAVVVADNKKARIFLIAAASAGEEETIKGNIKNHVRKGGWSQQRYERRRDNQLLLYAREIVDALAQLYCEEEFRRILLVGGKEILRLVRENLPVALLAITCDRALDLGQSEGELNRDIMELFAEEERRSERDLWEKIRRERLRGGLAAIGLDEVLAAAKVGRVEEMIVNRDFKPEGRRCRDCCQLEAAAVAACSACGSTSVYPVGTVNEIVELLMLTSATVDFAEAIPELTQAGEIAASLRY
jgi:peptide chain release factor subunit 1